MRISSLAVAATLAVATPAGAQAPAAQTPATPAQAPATFRCPDRVMVEEQPVAPAGTRPDAGRSERRFLAVDFFEGAYGDRSGALAPDTERRRGTTVTQTFVFDERRPRPVYGRCTYRDTAAAIFVDMPASLNHCTLTFTYNQRTRAVGTPGHPEQVECRP